MDELVNSFAAKCFASDSIKSKVLLLSTTGGSWFIDCLRKEVAKSKQAKPDLTIEGSEESLFELLSGAVTPQAALLTKRISVKGSREAALELSPYFLN